MLHSHEELSDPEGDLSGTPLTPSVNPPLASMTTNATDPPTVTDLETEETLIVSTCSEIETENWLEAAFGTVCPDCKTPLTDGTCPTCGYPDDSAQWRVGRLVMAIAKTLRSRHPHCRKELCRACRQVVARMNSAVVANDLQGLIALWREVTADAL
jgi:hypothetical protein